MKHVNRLVLTILGAALIAPAQPVAAQAVSDGSWRFQISPYFLAAGVKGSVQIQQLPELKLEAPFSDVISNLDIAFLGRFEGRKRDFGLATDVVYMNLGVPFAKDQPRISTLEPQIDIRQFVAEGIGFYRMRHSADFERAYVDLLVGARYLRLHNEIDTTRGDTIGSSSNFVDLIGGFRGRAPLASWAALLARGDIGGLGSKLSYNLEGILDFKISKSWTVGAGYRYLHYDFETDEGLQRRAADLSFSGPLVKATFTY